MSAISTTPFEVNGCKVASITAMKIYNVKVITATERNLQGYGRIVHKFEDAKVDIVTWPAPGWRPVLEGTGNEGGTVEGEFKMRWDGDLLYGENHAVDATWLTGWSTLPGDASKDGNAPRTAVFCKEANYHPDGGQIFFPKTRETFIALLARPGDNVRPEDFVAFVFDGSCGLHINAGVWHQPAIPLGDEMIFDDRQGAVHACIYCDTEAEFGGLLRIPLADIEAQP
jgi:ureidoglycolate lyase